MTLRLVAAMTYHPSGRVFVSAWVVTMAVLFWLAIGTTSVVAWAACAMAVVLPALTLMVLAHTPAKTVAEVLCDVEAGRVS